MHGKIKLQAVNVNAVSELQVDATQTDVEERLARHRNERLSVIKNRILEIVSFSLTQPDM
jgi:hypothetical protein